jgi:hypothetical protein
MHAQNQIRIIIGNDDPNPSAFDLSKITPLSIRLSFFAEGMGDYEFGVSTAQLVQPQPVPGVLRKSHGQPRTETARVFPLGAIEDRLASATRPD